MGSLDPFCKNSLFGILIFLFISNSFAGDACQKGCTSADTGKFNYKPGNVYEYSFDSLVTVSIHGANPDETALKVNGQAKVYAEGNCGYVLQLDKVIVTAAKENQRKQLHDIKKPVRFTLSNGILEPQICAEDDDTDTSLNVKRAIISLLQSTDKNHETDVFGVCPTTTSQSTIGNVDVVTKVRNLDNCGHREGLVHGLITGVVNNDAGIKSSSWLDSDYSAEQKILDGVITHVTVNEEYNYLPAAEGNNAVKTKVKTNLNLDKTSAGGAPQVNGKPQSIIFKHPHFGGTKNLDALKKTFDATVSQVDGYTKSDAAKYFTELIRLMRASDSATLDELSAISNQRPIGKKVFLDALFRTGTTDSVKTIANQVPRLNDKEKRLAFLSFNLVQSVDRQALASVGELLKDPNVPNEAYLSIGHLIEKYCDEHSCDDDVVMKILKEYVTALKRCDSAGNRHDEDKIVYILKGLRNTNHLVKQAANAVANCATAEHSARIRVAALQAFSAGGCNQNLQDKSLDILRNQNEDSEIRIEAYLAAVSCPNAQLANHISDIVNKEEVYQVGGFITAHLKGIRDSTDTTRASAKYFLGNIRITKKFPIDPRRYSFNSELSYAVPSLGVGASADYNLIYSQNGFLPRSGRLNVTTELFGRQFNVFEFGARQENLETVLENYFGPKGYFNDNNYQGLYDKTFRPKRSINDQTDKFFKSYKPYGGKPTSNVNLDISTKLFGSEMLFLSLGDNIPTDVEQIGRLFGNVLQQFKENAKSYEHTFSGSCMIVDAEIVYPTSIGFPLELTSQATATGTIDLGISVEIENVASNPSNSNGRIKFIPSVSVHANSQIRIVTGVLNTGIRTVTDLHSATGANVQISIFNNGNSFNVDIDLPRKKIDLIELKHDSDIFVAESDKPTKAYPLKSKPKTGGSGRFDQLSMFGLTVNYVALVPDNDDSPSAICFIGPVHLALSIESESKISLNGKHEKTSTQEYWQLTYDTPGSQQPHKSVFTFEVGHIPSDRLYARAQFENPHKKYGVEIGGLDNGRELAVYGKYEGDGDVTTAKIGFQINGQEYRPILQTATRNDNKIVNDIAGYSATGSVIAHNGPNDDKRYEFKDLTVIAATGKQLTVTGTATRSKTGLSADLNVKSGEDKFNINGLISIQAGDYQFNAYVEDLSTHNKYGGGIKLNHGPGKILVDVNVKSFDIIIDVHELYEYSEEGNEDTHGAPHYLKFENAISIAGKNNLILSVKLNGLIDKDHINYDFDAKRLDKQIGVYVDIKENEKGPGNYKVDAKANFNKHFIDAKYNYEIQGSGKANVDHSLTASTGLKFTIRGHVSPKPTSQDIDIDLNGDWMASHKDKPSTWLFKMTATPEKHSSEFKLNRDNADLLIYTGEVNRPSDKPMNGKINLNVKDTLVAKGDFKLAKNGRGDLSFLLNFKKVQKKIKLDTKFLISSPKYDIEATLNLDPDKDKTKKIYFKTETIIDIQKYNTNNILEILSDKYTFESNGAYSGDFNKNGDADGKFVLTLPNGRNINGDLRRHIATQNDKSSGTGVITLTDTLSSGEKRSLKLTGTLSDYNSEHNTFNLGHKLDLTDINGQQTHLQTTIKHLPKGHFNTAEFGVNFNGALAPYPIELNIILDEYCEEHAVYRIKCSDGTSDINLSGNYHVGNNEKPYDYDVTLNVNAPKTNAKTISIKSNGKLLLSNEPNGQHSGELHYHGKIGETNAQFNVKANGNNNQLTYHVDLQVPDKAPFRLDGNYQDTTNDKLYKHQESIVCDYFGQVIKSSVDLQVQGDDNIALHFSLHTPYESAKSVDVTFKGTKTGDSSYTTNTQVVYNSQKYGLNTVITLENTKSEIQLTGITPETTAIIAVHSERIGDRKAKASLKIENVLGFDFRGTAEGSFQNYEDFYITAKLDSNNLKLNQFAIEASSADGSNGKGVVILVKDADNVIINGKATYNVKQDKGKAIIEGQGTIQYYQKQTNANFKLVRQKFEAGQDDESGFSYIFNGTFGPKNIVSEIKITTKNFHIKLASCEEKKQCTNFEIKSVVTIDPKKPRSSTHKAMILIDLKELGYPHEFELQSETKQNGLHVEHEIEINIISNNNNKYQFVANLKPSKNVIALKLPKRELSLETVHTVPKDSFLGRYENTIAFYFDKTNKPNEKTQLTISGDVNAVENTSFNAKGGVKFEHPSIRPLSANGVINIDKNKQLFTAQCAFDIFKTPKQKIVGTYKLQGIPIQGQGYNTTLDTHFKSDGLNFHYEFSGVAGINVERHEISLSGKGGCQKSGLSYSGYLFTNGNDFDLSLNGFETELVHANGRINKKGKVHTDTKLQLLGFKPITLTGEIDTANIGASFGIKQDNLLHVSGDFKLTKEAKLNVQGGGKQLANARIALDPGHFLSTTYDVNKDDVAAFFKTFEDEIKKDTEHARENVKKRYEKAREAFKLQLETLKKSSPDFSKLGDSYKQNLHEILTELEQDPLLHDSIGAYKQTYESFAKFLEEFVKTVSESYEKIYNIGADLYTKVAQAINDELIPLVQAYTDKVVAEIGQLYTDTVKILGSTLDEVLKTLKALEADLSKIGKPLYEFFSSVFESLTELYKSIEQELQEFVNEVVSGLKSLPKPQEIYESIKQKIVGVEIFDDLLVFLAEALNSMQEYVQTEEGKELFAKLHSYVDAKLKKQQVNDAEKLEEIYTAFINAIRSYLSSGQSEGFFESLFTPLPYAFDAVGQLPLWTGFEFSPLNFLQNEEYDQFSESIVIRPPFNLLPPYELRGHIADGEHIFTFDGKHMTFPGSCSYILAQDSLHNNFSVVANLKDGKMKSIYLIDKENFAEVNDQGILKLNGKNHEYPAHNKDIHAWRKYYTVSLLTEYGVLVHCTIDLRVCNVKVNGYYTGRTRGLLGNGNSEPYDDYVKPNGQIGSDYANFGNSYGIGNCPQVAPEDHSHHEKSPICKELFDLDSTLFFGYAFMNPTNYREACNHAVAKAANKEDAACNIALAYASAGRDDLPIFVPKQCLKCNPNTQEQRNIGATFETKVPNNKADVVFVVDISLDTDHITNLVNPVIKDVRNQLKSRGIPDVHVAVIGYDYNLKYPQLYTTNGKLNFNGNLNDVIADGPKYEELETVGVPEVDKILAEAKKSRSQSITSSDAAAFRLAIAYPFRADASKVIVVVRHDNLEYTNVFKSFNAIMTNQLVRSKGISLHLVSPVKDISVQGVDTEKIIGFNTRLVATTEGKDAKKLSKLQYTGDMGVDLVNNDDGWIFALQNFQHQKTPEQKKIFVQTISSSIAEHTSKMETISDCECKMVYGLHAEDTCSVESSKFVPGKKGKAN